MAQQTVLIGHESNVISTLLREMPKAWVEEDTDIRYCCLDTSSSITDYAWNYVDVNITEWCVSDTPTPGVMISKGLKTINVRTTRHSKFFQAVFINHVFKNVDAWPEFRKLKTWKNDADYDGSGDVLVKRPLNGARGIGQLVFDSKVTSLESIQAAHFFFDGQDKDGISIKPSSDEIVEISKSKELPEADASISSYNQRFNNCLNEHCKGAVWYSEGDRRKGEGYQIFKEGSFLQEYAANVISEYRFIIGGRNEVSYVLERERRDYGKVGKTVLASASGAKRGPDKSFTSMAEAGIPASVMQGFKHLLNNYDFSLFSFDVFLTADGKWGIFEFSNEFGSLSVPNGFVNRETRAFIRRITNT